MQRSVVVATATLITLALLPLRPGPALSAVKADRSIEVFWGISFVLLRDYPADTDVLVEVLRGPDNVVVGRQTVTTDGTGFYEINHVGGGQPPAGDCWEVTPQTLPGDTVRTTVVGSDPPDVDTTAVRDVFIDLEAIAFDAPAGTITVSGHARTSTVAPIVPGSDVLEFRLNRSPGSGVWSVNGRKDLREDVGADVDPVTGDFTHVFSGLSASDVSTAESAGVDQIIEWSAAVVEGAATPEITVFDGMGAQLGGCPPVSEYAVTNAQPPVVNLATAGDDLALSGVATDATGVSVTLSDGTTTTTPVSATVTPASGAQTWTAIVPWAEVSALSDGQLQAAASYTVAGGAIGGGNLAVLKDLVAPAAPTATPPGGSYATTQAVTLGNPVETALPIHFTVDGTAPDALDPRYTQQILVTADQTIRAVAIDPAGNASPVSVNAYVIGGPPVITVAPVQSLITGSTLGTPNVPVRVTWAASDPQGIASYNLQQSTDGGAFFNVSLPSPTATAITRFLAPGRSYRFQVRATDGAGNTSLYSAGASRLLSVVQQTSPSVAYVGVWATFNDAGFSGGSVRATSVAGRTATFSFSGTNVGWVSTRANDRGRATVSVDGGAPVTVDLFSSGTAKRRLVFATNNLAPGSHTLKVTVLGSKSPSSSGTRVDVDAFEVMAP